MKQVVSDVGIALTEANARRRSTQKVRGWVTSGGRSSVTEPDPELSGTDDQALALSEEPPLGAHLITPRIGFVHHGIYVGHGKVMHCGAVSCFLPRGPVEEVSLGDFRRGRAVAVRGGGSARFAAEEVVDRARSRLGENHYRILTNNCEHFCEWCVRGEHRSYQIERLMRWLRLLGAVFGGRFLAWSDGAGTAARSGAVPGSTAEAL
jgi:Lecithin retinol acyltransferase